MISTSAPAITFTRKDWKCSWSVSWELYDWRSFKSAVMKTHESNRWSSTRKHDSCVVKRSQHWTSVLPNIGWTRNALSTHHVSFFKCTWLKRECEFDWCTFFLFIDRKILLWEEQRQGVLQWVSYNGKNRGQNKALEIPPYYDWSG